MNTLSTSYPLIWALSTRGAFPGWGTVIEWYSLLNSIGCSDPCKYSVVTKGDVIARLTSREMLFPLCATSVEVVLLRWYILWMGCILHHCCFLGLADSILVPLCWLPADLLAVHCLCFHHSLASLLQLIYFLLLPVVLRTSCNPSLRAGKLICRWWTHSVGGMVHLACHMVIVYTPLILLTRTSCCFLSLLPRSSDALNFYDRLLGRCYLYILWLLDYESHSYHSCGISSFDCCICFFCHLRVTASFYCYRRLHRPRICLLYPLTLILSLA
jgi:hypothetical protein